MSASVFASVTFLKIQEFARRPVSEQARLRAQLAAVVAVTAAEIEPARRIVLEASDGVAVLVLGDPPAALRLAERALTAVAAGLPLSAGLNHGAVQIAESGNGGTATLIDRFQHKGMPCLRIQHDIKLNKVADPFRFIIDRCRVADGSWKFL